MKFKLSEKEIGLYSKAMDKQKLPYTVERDQKGSYLVTELNEEEFMALMEEDLQ